MIYAPIGIEARLVGDVPAALKQARQQLVFARFIGKIAVDQGVQQLRQLLAADVTEPDVADPDPAESPPPANTASAPPTAPSVPGDAAAPAPEELALPDYDQLPAAHIVSKLNGLTSTELDAIEAYEMVHRHRRTVLGKIAQLQAT